MRPYSLLLMVGPVWLLSGVCFRHLEPRCVSFRCRSCMIVSLQDFVSGNRNFSFIKKKKSVTSHPKKEKNQSACMNNHGPDTLGPTRGTPAVGGPCYMQAASPRNSPWRFLKSGKGPNGKRDAIKGKRRRSSFYQIFHEFWPWDSLKPTTVHASASLTSCSSGAILCKMYTHSNQNILPFCE